MHRKFIAIASLAVAAIALTTAAAASPSSAKQRVTISVKGASFVLTPLTSGGLQADNGGADFCCWTERQIVRDGEAITVNNPQMTLTGKHGTLVARNRIEWADISNGWAVFTGTWKVVRGTGDYAGLSGGGRAAGAKSPPDSYRSRFMGLVGAN